MDIYKVLSEFMASHATDLHIVDGAPPLMRIDGKIIFTNYQALSAQESQSLIYAMLTDKQKSVFESKNELDLGFGVKGVGRIRANIYRQRGAVCASLRKIPNKFFTFEELGLPSIALEVMKIPVGLVLVTGATGSGKTTTLASMINYLNENRSSHIITIEDPIEYVHEHKKSIISQREIGSDSETFSSALKYVLRQDPDTILIGEMRDLETVQAAITVAETGHLVFATLHTPDAIQSINRIVDVFPPHQQPQIRNQLSFVLQAIFSQELVPKLDGGLSLGGSGHLAALKVDDFGDEIDAYVKPLLPPISRLWGASGLTIMGDGRPVFLLDVQQIISKALATA